MPGGFAVFDVAGGRPGQPGERGRFERSRFVNEKP